MTMTKLTAAAIVLVSAQAFAGIKLESRADYQNSTYNTDAGLKEYSTTQVSRLRLAIDQAVNEQVSFSGRLDLNTTTSATAVNRATAPNTGSPSNMVDYAMVSYKVMPELAISMGKLAVVGGGMENAYNFGDVYMVSHLVSTNTIANAGGVGLTYTMGDHQFDVQMTNDDAATEQKNIATRSMTGAQYYGKFMDSKLQVIASYQTMKYGTSDKVISYTTAGVKYDLGVALFDLDYGMKKDEFNGTTAGNDETSGFVFQATVPVVEKIRAIAKYESSQDKDNGTKSHTYSNAGVAFEYAMAAGSNFHVAYNMLADKTESSGITAKENQVIVGFKMYADLVK